VELGVPPSNFACPNLIVQHEGGRTGVSDAASPWSGALAQA
jgi:gamma-glutamyltranspeptidase / glutathione hydrolase